MATVKHNGVTFTYDGRKWTKNEVSTALKRNWPHTEGLVKIAKHEPKGEKIEGFKYPHPFQKNTEITVGVIGKKPKKKGTRKV